MVQRSPLLPVAELAQQQWIRIVFPPSHQATLGAIAQTDADDDMRIAAGYELRDEAVLIQLAEQAPDEDVRVRQWVRGAIPASAWGPNDRSRSTGHRRRADCREVPD